VSESERIERTGHASLILVEERKRYWPDGDIGMYGSTTLRLIVENFDVKRYGLY
jgi:hypothetical protein